MENPIYLQSKTGSLQAIVDLNGGMLSQLYAIKGESKHAIFHQAPWLKENYYQDQAGLMEHLSGEWACVPFGFVGSIKNLGGYCTTIINILIENYTKLTFRRGNRSMASMR